MNAHRVTIADVARRAGVSPGAVSFALNDRPGVGEQTRQRILQAAAELNWKPNVRARSLSRSRSFALGLVVARRPELLGADPFFPSFIAGVESVLAQAGQSLVLNVVPTRRAEEETYRRLAADSRVDGVFLTDLRTRDPRVALLRELQLPAVTLGRPDGTSPFPAVTLDDSAGVAAAVARLIELGHRRIGHVSGPARFLHARSRTAAWRRELERAGLPVGPVAQADFTPASGAAATIQLLAADPAPTAIVYANDVMAIAGMAVAQQRGIAIGRELSVTGYDDIELAQHLNPPLCTIRTDPYGWGREATTVLLRLLDGEQPDDLELPPATLIERASIGPPPPGRARRRAGRDRTTEEGNSPL